MPDILDTSSVTSMSYTWSGCSSLSYFGPDTFKNCLCTSFAGAFYNCALPVDQVDKILVNIESNGTSNGTLHINAGTNATPSQTGKDATDTLRARGWTVTLNGY